VLLRLLLLFTVVPLAELYLLLWLAHVTSPLVALATVIVTGIIGASLARHQGWRTWVRIQEQLAAGRMPASELVDGLLILIAGALLITPGILTDAVGFSLLIPPLRRRIRGAVAEWFKRRATWQVHQMGGTTIWSHRSSDETIIDAEFTRHASPEPDEPDRLP